MVVRPCSYQERALPTELCGPVCTKLYCKSIRVNRRQTIPVPIWNVTYKSNRRISGEILKDGLVKGKKEVLETVSVGEKVYMDLMAGG